MIKFLNRYRVAITIALILSALSFWFVPSQEKLYLHSEFELVKKNSHKFLIGALIITGIVILVLALRKAENSSQIFNVFIGVATFSLALYFVLQTIFLSVFLLLNRIERGARVEEQYAITTFLEQDKRTPVIYDFKRKKILFFDKVENIEKLAQSQPGDTIILCFSKGLLGYNFEPKVK